MKYFTLISSIFFTIECKEVIENYKGRKYLFEDKRVSRNEAIKVCEQKSMDFATIYSEKELNFVYSVMKEDFVVTDFFIGTNCVNSRFIWNDGRQIDFGIFSDPSHRQCDSSKYLKLNNFTFVAASVLSGTSNILCADSISTRSRFVIRYTESRIFLFNSTYDSIQNHRKACNDYSMDIASFRTEKEMALVKEIMTTEQSHWVWIGMRCLNETYTWLDGRTVTIGQVARDQRCTENANMYLRDGAYIADRFNSSHCAMVCTENVTSIPQHRYVTALQEESKAIQISMGRMIESSRARMSVDVQNQTKKLLVEQSKVVLKVDSVQAEVKSVEVSLVHSMAIVYGLLGIVVLLCTLISVSLVVLALKNHASAEKERKTGAAYNVKDDDVNIYNEPFVPA